MCKVVISNRGSNFSHAFNYTSKEFDIPSDIVPVLEDIFSELNSTRITATDPIINIKKA